MSDHRGRPTFSSIIQALSTRISALEVSGIAQPNYTTATRPAATDVRTGTIIFVSDAADGQRFQGSDGTNWKTLG